MFKINIDIKTIFIIILCLIVVIMILFRPSKSIDYYEGEIKLLKEKNTFLLKSNDSIISLNDNLQKDIDILNQNVDSVNLVLIENKKEIKKLKKRKSEVLNNVNNMVVNDVTRNLTDYIERNHWECS